MQKNIHYYNTSPINQVNKDLLVERWNEPLFNDIKHELISFLQCRNIEQANNTISKFPEITVLWNTKEFNLIDLRGFNFDGLFIGQLDFSYCCFDFASFKNCTFEETWFQYSSFYQSDLSNSIWNLVQASPTNLKRANLTNAIIKKTFLMGTDFTDAIMTNISLDDFGL